MFLPIIRFCLEVALGTKWDGHFPFLKKVCIARIAYTQPFLIVLGLISK